jgi:prepilin-type N-terminal cleavage/methylation domain-containing protein
MNTHRAGFSILELVIVASIAAILAGIAAPLGRAIIDRHAVRSARDTIVGALALTRATAIMHGGATLELDGAAGTLHVRLADGAERGDALHLHRVHGVRIELSGGDAAEIRYDALGIGRMANRTIRVRRGRNEAGLTVSAYGRWRAW